MEIIYVNIILLYIFTILGVFYLPSIIAFQRNHSDKYLIFIVNTFFGFTIIGWLGSLIWATTNNVAVKS